MKIKKIDLKKAHFGSKQEEWAYLELLLMEEISQKLDRLIEMFEKKPDNPAEIKIGETKEIEIVEHKEISEQRPKKRGRKKKKVDDEK